MMLMNERIPGFQSLMPLPIFFTFSEITIYETTDAYCIMKLKIIPNAF